MFDHHSSAVAVGHFSCIGSSNAHPGWVAGSAALARMSAWQSPPTDSNYANGLPSWRRSE